MEATRKRQLKKRYKTMIWLGYMCVAFFALFLDNHNHNQEKFNRGLDSTLDINTPDDRFTSPAHCRTDIRNVRQSKPK